jgi:regulator of sigma E protease
MGIRESNGTQFALHLQRNGQNFAVDVVPDVFSERGQRLAGLVLQWRSRRKPARIAYFVSYGFFEAGQKALRETWDKSIFSLVMLGKMLTGEVSWKNFSGPVTIADYAGQSARLGLDYYVKFMALISISLGVLNLLPIPVLDGGHLMYHMIRSRQAEAPFGAGDGYQSAVRAGHFVLLDGFCIF